MEHWYGRLGAAQFTTTSCGGFWSIMGTAEGRAVVEHWYGRLTRKQFATTSCNGFWSLVNTVDGLALVETWFKRIGIDKFPTVSCGGFWAILGTAAGRAVVEQWFKDLGVSNFATMSSCSFWHFLSLDGGDARARRWRKEFADDFVTICKHDGFWALMSEDDGAAKMSVWHKHFGERFKQVANGGFFAMLRRPGGADRITRMKDELGDATFCKVMTGGLWAFIKSHGEDAAMDWMDFLSDNNDLVQISRLDSFWSLLNEDRAGLAAQLVRKWVPKVAHTGVGHDNSFWMVLARPGGEAFILERCTFSTSGGVTNARRSFQELKDQFKETDTSELSLKKRRVRLSPAIDAAQDLEPSPGTILHNHQLDTTVSPTPSYSLTAVEQLTSNW